MPTLEEDLGCRVYAPTYACSEQAVCVDVGLLVMKINEAMNNEPLTVVAVGDCIISRKVSGLHNSQFLKVVELLRHADCAYGNCEIPLFDHWDGWSRSKGVDLPLFCEPFGADELAWLGFKIMGVANNHTMDYGCEGMKSTIAHLDRVRIAHAGAGLTLGQAARPAYCETGGGRLALVNCTSTFPKWAMAVEAREDTNGRPGVNGLRMDRAYRVDSEALAQFRNFLQHLLRMGGASLPQMDNLKDHILISRALCICPPPDVCFIPSAPAESAASISTIRAEDSQRVLGRIGIAKRNSNIVLATLHAHEYCGSQEVPDGFQQSFAHACIDAGADAFIAAGPHILRGIELYRNKPVFYSLGNFLGHIGTIKALPSDSYAEFGLATDTLDPSLIYDIWGCDRKQGFWESVVAQITYLNGAVADIKVYAIELGGGKPRFGQGTPTLADSGTGKRIIKHLANLSRPFGTSITFENGVGIVHATRRVGGVKRKDTGGSSAVSSDL